MAFPTRNPPFTAYRYSSNTSDSGGASSDADRDSSPAASPASARAAPSHRRAPLLLPKRDMTANLNSSQWEPSSSRRHGPQGERYQRPDRMQSREGYDQPPWDDHRDRQPQQGRSYQQYQPEERSYQPPQHQSPYGQHQPPAPYGQRQQQQAQRVYQGQHQHQLRQGQHARFDDEPSEPFQRLQVVDRWRPHDPQWGRTGAANSTSRGGRGGFEGPSRGGYARGFDDVRDARHGDQQSYGDRSPYAARGRISSPPTGGRSPMDKGPERAKEPDAFLPSEEYIALSREGPSAVDAGDANADTATTSAATDAAATSTADASATAESTASRSTSSPPVPKLLVLDLNGTLIYRPSRPGGRKAYPRPFLSCFLQYLFDADPDGRAWEVFVWSSAQPHNVRHMVETCFGGYTRGVYEPETEEERTAREEKGEGRLLGVWARDTLGLGAGEYGRKVQTRKDLRKITAHLPTYDERTTVLLDDSPLKAVYQPWSQIVIPEYDKPEFNASRAAAEALLPSGRKVRAYTPSRAVEDAEEPKEANAEAVAEGADLASAAGMDNILLAVIGILEDMRGVANVPAWVRGGALQRATEKVDLAAEVTLETLPSWGEFVHWYAEEGTHAYWVKRGREALRRRGIGLEHGLPNI